MSTNALDITETLPIITDSDGVIRIAPTRVTLDTLVNAFEDGATAEEIAQQYPAVSLADIYSLIGYYLRRRPEIEAYLAQRRQTAESARQNNEAYCNPTGIRARLLARRVIGAT
ncbi:MAG: DUF433 domain-containing protein [Candidatus Competibacteraceae bacterium]|nr:DUF433 domain-containing protein [Candidatus Competibacteraceae bacterium]